VSKEDIIDLSKSYLGRSPPLRSPSLRSVATTRWRVGGV